MAHKHKPIEPITVWYEVDTYAGTIKAFAVARVGDSMFTRADGLGREQYRRDRHFKTWEKARDVLREYAQKDVDRLREYLARSEKMHARVFSVAYESKPAHFLAMEKDAETKSYRVPTYSQGVSTPGEVIERAA